MALFVLCHWCGIAYARFGPKKPNQFVKHFFTAPTVGTQFLILITSVLTEERTSRRLLNHEILGARVDRLLLYLIYWALNLILALTNVEFERVDHSKAFQMDRPLTLTLGRQAVRMVCEVWAARWMRNTKGFLSLGFLWQTLLYLCSSLLEIHRSHPCLATHMKSYDLFTKSLATLAS
jgi:hypothetical protein